jgi:hypothetical protein
MNTHLPIIISAVQILHPGCRVVAIRELTLSPACQQRLNAKALLRDLRQCKISNLQFHLRGFLRGWLKR